MAHYQIDQFEIVFEDILGLILCAERYGCSYSSEVSLHGHLWQAGIKGYCGDLYDHVGLYIKYSSQNTTFCRCNVTIEVSTEDKLSIPKKQFYPGQESFALLCKYSDVSKRLKVLYKIERQVDQSTAWPFHQNSELNSFLPSDSKFCDCQLVTNNRIFAAHTCVVAAHSHVLMSSLLASTSVQLEARFSREAVALFVHFMYRGFIPACELEVYLCPLIDLAATYHVYIMLDYLTHQLQYFLSDGLVVSILNIAHRHNLNAVCFIVHQYSAIRKSNNQS